MYRPAILLILSRSIVDAAIICKWSALSLDMTLYPMTQQLIYRLYEGIALSALKL